MHKKCTLKFIKVNRRELRFFMGSNQPERVRILQTIDYFLWNVCLFRRYEAVDSLASHVLIHHMCSHVKGNFMLRGYPMAPKITWFEHLVFFLMGWVSEIRCILSSEVIIYSKVPVDTEGVNIWLLYLLMIQKTKKWLLCTMLIIYKTTDFK